jgi:nucleoside-specific outer membrane channel protein Tsx
MLISELAGLMLVVYNSVFVQFNMGYSCMKKKGFYSVRNIFVNVYFAIMGVLGFGLSDVALAGAAKWSSSNIQYLKGSSYMNVGTKEEVSASVLTLEHVNGWKYGDNFFFVDVTNPDNSNAEFDTGFYGEIAPRLSLSAITGKSLKLGPIKDILISTGAEYGQGFYNYLYGFAVDFNIPKTPVAQFNYYIRNEIGTNKDAGSQITLVWLTPFDIGSASFTFEGFFDYAFGMDHVEDNIITGPRLLLDVGKTCCQYPIHNVEAAYKKMCK